MIVAVEVLAVVVVVVVVVVVECLFAHERAM